MNTKPPTSPEGESPESIDAQVQRELDEALDGQDMEQLLASAAAESSDPSPDASAETTAPFKRKMVRGRITAVHGEDVFVDVHGVDGKNQGVVPLVQFERAPRVGSIMDFVVQQVDPSELIILSREGAVGRATWEQLDRGSVVEARVTTSNKGGLELEIVGGIRAFMPASQVDLHYVEQLESFVGQKLKAHVQEINRQAKKIVLSRRSLLESERQTNQARLWDQLQVGQTLQGTVSGVMDYGVFVDLGGLDGLVHVREMSYGRIDKPADVTSVGQTVTVKVLKIDPEAKRITLGMKQIEPDPWQGIADRVRAGDQLSARVVRTASFGAFAEVEPGVEGLIPISELSWKRVARTTEVVKEGDVVPLAVLSIDADQHRITLSLKQAQGDPWIGAEHKYAAGNTAEATVLSLADFGAFVELERGVEGLVHISELSDHRVASVGDVLQVGQKERFRVLAVDEDQRRIRLSLKTATPQPKTTAPTQTPVKPGARKKPDTPLKGGLE